MRWPYLPYNVMVLTVTLAVAALPPLAAVIVLRNSVAGMLLAPVLAWWIGTALIAAVYAVHGQDLFSDAGLLRRSLRGARGAARDAAVLWLPSGIAAMGIMGATTLSGSAPWLSILLGALLVLMAVVGSAIAGCFSFRGRDLWRLSIAFVVLRPLSALGAACLVLIAGVCVVAVGEWVLLLIGGLFAVLLDRTAMPILDHIRSTLVA